MPPRTNNPPPKPLWARLLEDESTQDWLKEHAKEFPSNSFLPDDVAFKDKASAYQQFISDTIAELIPELKGDDAKIAKLYLRTHPARIANAMGWERKDVYLAIRRLKRRALRTWQQRRDRQVFARAGNLELDAPPEMVAVRTVRFAKGNTERRAFLVDRDGVQLWVDEAGAVFPDDVQEILHDLPDLTASFEVLDADAEV